jgi:hypothetical protein
MGHPDSFQLSAFSFRRFIIRYWTAGNGNPIGQHELLADLWLKVAGTTSSGGGGQVQITLQSADDESIADHTGPAGRSGQPNALERKVRHEETEG